MKILSATILIAPVFALAILANSAAAETRNLSGFTGVGSAGQFNVEITIGNGYAVDVSGPDAEKIQTRVEGSSLQIRGTGWHMFGEPHYNATVRITMPGVEALSAARGSLVRASGVRADHLALASTMGGEIRITGACQDLSASASMGGELYANELDCAGASVSASMGGDARVHARQSLSASASMGGAIHVSGNPQTRSAQASMGGDINFE